MAWSYSGDPFSSAKDAVRFLLGDTDQTDQLTLSDEEIDWLLVEWDNTYFAAAAGAEQLSGQFAREVTYSVDGVNYTGTELQEKYLRLAERLRASYKTRGSAAMPFDGSNYQKDSRLAIEHVGMGMHDNRRDGANATVMMDPLEGGDSGLAEG